MSDQREIATLAGGCFWCIEAVFELVRGVEKVESGYIGGHVVNVRELVERAAVPEGLDRELSSRLVDG